MSQFNTKLAEKTSTNKDALAKNPTTLPPSEYCADKIDFRIKFNPDKGDLGSQLNIQNGNVGHINDASLNASLKKDFKFPVNMNTTSEMAASNIM